MYCLMSSMYIKHTGNALVAAGVEIHIVIVLQTDLPLASATCCRLVDYAKNL